MTLILFPLVKDMYQSVEQAKWQNMRLRALCTQQYPNINCEKEKHDQVALPYGLNKPVAILRLKL